MASNASVFLGNCTVTRFNFLKNPLPKSAFFIQTVVVDRQDRTANVLRNNIDVAHPYSERQREQPKAATPNQACSQKDVDRVRSKDLLLVKGLPYAKLWKS